MGRERVNAGGTTEEKQESTKHEKLSNWYSGEAANLCLEIITESMSLRDNNLAIIKL